MAAVPGPSGEPAAQRVARCAVSAGTIASEPVAVASIGQLISPATSVWADNRPAQLATVELDDDGLV